MMNERTEKVGDDWVKVPDQGLQKRFLRMALTENPAVQEAGSDLKPMLAIAEHLYANHSYLNNTCNDQREEVLLDETLQLLKSAPLPEHCGEIEAQKLIARTLAWVRTNASRIKWGGVFAGMDPRWLSRVIQLIERTLTSKEQVEHAKQAVQIVIASAGGNLIKHPMYEAVESVAHGAAERAAEEAVKPLAFNAAAAEEAAERGESGTEAERVYLRVYNQALEILDDEEQAAEIAQAVAEEYAADARHREYNAFFEKMSEDILAPLDRLVLWPECR
jgi:hypothetical protein